MSTEFTGLYPALMTPLTSDRQLNIPVAQAMLQHLLRGSARGTYIAGSTGEGLRQTVAQRKLLLETLMPVLPAGKNMIVHVGAADIKDALALAEHAAAQGATAVSSLPPTGDTKRIRDYYTELASESALPLILYYFPKVAPHAFEDPQDLIDVCALPNVIGVKFTDFNVYLMQRLIQRGMTVFNGYDEALAAGLLMGAQGGIGSTYNVMGEVYAEIFRAAGSGQWEIARTWQRHANRTLEIMLRYPFFPALREMMRHLGFDCGPLLSGETLSSSQQRCLMDDLDREMPPEIANLIAWTKQ